MHSIKPEDPAELAPDFLDIYAYWNDLRNDRFAPSWGEFKLQDLDLAFIPW
ncbi:MAG: hypothetical protein OSA23_00160 [Rhodospirillales bacterium]|nr:hypothetical protein [Rhodospirillales bacterium]